MNPLPAETIKAFELMGELGNLREKVKKLEATIAFLTEDRDYWKAQCAKRRYRT